MANSTENKSILKQLISDIEISKRKAATAEQHRTSVNKRSTDNPRITSNHHGQRQDGDTHIVNGRISGKNQRLSKKSQSMLDQKKKMKINFAHGSSRSTMSLEFNDAGLPITAIHANKNGGSMMANDSSVDRRPSPIAVLMSPLPGYDLQTQKLRTARSASTCTTNTDDSLTLSVNKRIHPLPTADGISKTEQKGTRRAGSQPSLRDDKKSLRKKTYTMSGGISEKYLRTLVNWADKVEAADKKDDNDDYTSDEWEEPRINPVRVKFIKLCRIVRLFVRVCAGMKEYAFKRNTSSFIDLNYYTVDNGNTRSKSLAFSRKEYARSTTMHMPQWARTVLRSSPEERTHDELLNLRNLFRGLGCYERFPNYVQLELARHFQFCRFEEGRVVVRQGHEGYSFYMIFHGSLSVYIDTESKGKTYSRTENILTPGVCFGELALISETKQRTATIKARETVELLAIDDDVFQQYCAQEFRREHREKIDRARQFDIFNNWSDDLLSAICFESQLQEFKHGKVIDCNTAVSLSVNFLMEGKCDCLREVDLNKIPKDAKMPFIHPGQRLDTPLTVSTKKVMRNQLNSKVLLYVGSLTEGDACDLSTVYNDHTPGFTLVSAGAKVLRISKKKLKHMAPTGWIQSIKSKSKVPIMLTTDEELCRRFTEFENWEGFKNMTLNEALLKIKRHDLAQMAATKKGTSGWARWPGQSSNLSKQKETSNRLSRPTSVPVSVYSNLSSTRTRNNDGRYRSSSNVAQREMSGSLYHFREQIRKLHTDNDAFNSNTQKQIINSAVDGVGEGETKSQIRQRSRILSTSLINDRIRQKFLRSQNSDIDENSVDEESNDRTNEIRLYLKKRGPKIKLSVPDDDPEEDVLVEEMIKTTQRLSRAKGSLGSIYYNRDPNNAVELLRDTISSATYDD